jgi:hypothetical protein
MLMRFYWQSVRDRIFIPIDKYSINTILPQINNSSEVIQNTVAAGKIVTISQSQATMYN